MIVKESKDQHARTIGALSQWLKTVSLRSHDEEVLKVDRVQLLSNWIVQPIVQEQVFTCGSYPDPTSSSDLQCDIWKGAIKANMVEMFNKSSEAHVDVHKEPKVKVVATRAFKEGAFKLIGLTNNVSVHNALKSIISTTLRLGECFEIGNRKKFVAVAKSQLPPCCVLRRRIATLACKRPLSRYALRQPPLGSRPLRIRKRSRWATRL